MLPIRTTLVTMTVPPARPRPHPLPETPPEKAEYCVALRHLEGEPYALILTPSGLVVAVPSRNLFAFDHRYIQLFHAL